MSIRDAALKDELSPSQFRRLADARRAVWTGAAKGFAAGAALGGLGFLLGKASLRSARAWGRGEAAATVLLASAAGSFYASMTAAQPKFAELDDVFRVGANPLEVDGYEARRLAAAADSAEGRADAQAAHELASVQQHFIDVYKAKLQSPDEQPPEDIHTPLDFVSVEESNDG